jgi:hypothetical protein
MSSAVPGQGSGQDDDLLINGDHSGLHVDAVERKAEGLALAKTCPSSQQDEQRVPLRHGVGKREDLGGGEQPHDGLADFRKPDVGAGCLADVTITDCAAHDTGKDHVDSLNGARRETLD